MGGIGQVNMKELDCHQRKLLLLQTKFWHDIINCNKRNLHFTNVSAFIIYITLHWLNKRKLHSIIVPLTVINDVVIRSVAVVILNVELLSESL